MAQTDCNFDEVLVNKLEEASERLLSDVLGSDTIDYFTLNNNTNALNEQIIKYRNVRTQLSLDTRISARTKKTYGDSFIPSSIVTAYNDYDINTVRDLSDFISSNVSRFAPSFTSVSNVLSQLDKIDPNTFRSFAAEYPNIEFRLKSGDISSAEVSRLIAANGFNPNLFSSQLLANPKSMLNLLERFLAGLGIGLGLMGSFCSLVENVFALVNGQKDVFANEIGYSPQFDSIISSINPKLGEIATQISNVTNLLNVSLQHTTSVKTNMQDAFSSIAGAFGLTLNFFDSSTGSGGAVDVDWNLVAIRDSISASDVLFTTAIDSTNKPLGDVNQDGSVDGSDVVSFQSYMDGISTSEVSTYIETVMFPYMTENSAQFSQYVNFEGAESAAFSDLVVEFATVASFFGSPSSSGSDFGSTQISQMIGTIAGVASSVQQLASGSRPISVSSLISQLDSVAKSSVIVTQKLNDDFNVISESYKKTTGDALTQAEGISVSDPTKAEQISDDNQDALKNNYTAALQLTGTVSKNLGPVLNRTINQLKSSLNRLAAVGVLDGVERQLSGVVDQSAAQLNSKLAFFSPSSMDNQYGFNMNSVYSKNAGLIARARQAASPQATSNIKNVIKGSIAIASEKYRDRSKDEVEFVVLRFCQLAGEIERVYNQVAAPLESVQSSFVGIDQTLSAIGNQNTTRAIRAGATRYDTQTRFAAMQSVGSISSTLARGSAVGQQVAPYNGYGPTPNLPEGYQFPSYEDARSGVGGVQYSPGPASRLSGRAGFIPRSVGGGVDTESMYMLYLLARQWGQTIVINSAYRNPAANAKAGGAKSSLHLAGKAFDCSVSGRDNQVRFMNLAYQVGFRGFGSYSTFVHVDTAGARSWGNFRYYALSGPAGAKGT